MNGTKIYERKLIDYESLIAYLEERKRILESRYKRENDSYNCCILLGKSYECDILLDELRRIPF